MTTISWAQIDTNNSGYIDGNEVEVAKKMVQQTFGIICQKLTLSQI